MSVLLELTVLVTVNSGKPLTTNVDSVPLKTAGSVLMPIPVPNVLILSNWMVPPPRPVSLLDVMTEPTGMNQPPNVKPAQQDVPNVKTVNLVTCAQMFLFTAKVDSDTTRTPLPLTSVKLVLTKTVKSVSLTEKSVRNVTKDTTLMPPTKTVPSSPTPLSTHVLLVTSKILPMANVKLAVPVA